MSYQLSPKFQSDLLYALFKLDGEPSDFIFQVLDISISFALVGSRIIFIIFEPF